MTIKFGATVILVSDVKKSMDFYECLLEQKVKFDHGACIEFEGGFAIWEKKYAHNMMKVPYIETQQEPQKVSHEIYFESEEIEGVQNMLLHRKIRFVHEIYEQPWCQRVLRVYDPDGHIVEIGEPMAAVVRRFAKSGMQPEEICARTHMPLEYIINEIQNGV